MTPEEAKISMIAKAIAREWGWCKWTEMSPRSRKLFTLAAAQAYGVLKGEILE